MEKNEFEKKESEGFFRYFELDTEYGPLYVYEKYKNDPKKAKRFDHEIPVTREFFTNEEGIRGYGTLDFMNRTAVFKTTERNMNGEVSEQNMTELEPYEFLMKVAPFLETEEKAKEVYRIFDCKARNVGNTRIIKEQPEVSQKAKNEVAKILLKKHVI